MNIKYAQNMYREFTVASHLCNVQRSIEKCHIERIKKPYRLEYIPIHFSDTKIV